MTATIVSPTLRTTSTSRLITLAAGCFWGVEKVFVKQFADQGMVDIKVGYANGIPSISEIDYKRVCSGETQFAEAVQISYEPSKLPVGDILDIFFRMHDPTTLNSQGPDNGTQYRSVVMAHSDDDAILARAVKERIQKEYYPNHQIVTFIEPIKVWYDAEDYHQEYLKKHPTGYECPSHFIRTKPKV
ncbi:Peptide methionine sulfoxide reductase [Yamadazyma tenuis]|uniref:peptide-methionine (S)-S-oxide reductase n=1 Tax=Candida tenuis (strain ATCC 10573 / BCRC 21748 / CBS 615 / JCM 9827 / NBRC 10315 / NRRL Y-1498 / VKM Y-70) TaxID=590646 RepID=G3BC32_CANTC|nr:methionine sulfoxide reductase A [Yamadazyma tenuis ATCC 10573]EGV60770.1 methionine sulfoxide reductase A [Yamadazyma tenuis ATCC 10573]WEJ93957.1 Peptide methionine sulfoxide reductase [Yamadazyma tenuis]